MPTFHIHGRVLPDGVLITIEGLPLQTWENLDGKRTTYLVNIVESHVGVEVNAEEYPELDISQITSQALELARAAVDSFCFHQGWGLTVIMERFFDDDGTETVLLPVLRGVGDNIKESFNAHTIHVVERGSLDTLYNYMASDPSVSLAFNDLIAAITFPRFAEINCARSVEGIRILISGLEMKDSQSWEMMRNALNLSKEYLQEITDLSRKPRHGYRHYIPPQIVEVAIQRAWEVMRRYIVFATTRKPLPLESYPVLDKEASQTAE